MPSGFNVRSIRNPNKEGHAMRQSALILCLSLILLSGAALFSAGPAGAAQAPAFELTTLQGQDMSLRDLTDGRHALLVFWTTWCPSCRQTMPEVDQLASEHSRDDLAVLGINAGWNDSPQQAERFRDKHELGFPIAFDEAGRISGEYGLRGVPTLFLVGPQGTILYQSYSVNEQLLQSLKEITSE